MKRCRAPTGKNSQIPCVGPESRVRIPTGGEHVALGACGPGEPVVDQLDAGAEVVHGVADAEAAVAGELAVLPEQVRRHGAEAERRQRKHHVRVGVLRLGGLLDLAERGERGQNALDDGWSVSTSAAPVAFRRGRAAEATAVR